MSQWPWLLPQGDREQLQDMRDSVVGLDGEVCGEQVLESLSVDTARRVAEALGRRQPHSNALCSARDVFSVLRPDAHLWYAEAVDTLTGSSLLARQSHTVLLVPPTLSCWPREVHAEHALEVTAAMSENELRSTSAWSKRLLWLCAIVMAATVLCALCWVVPWDSVELLYQRPDGTYMRDRADHKCSSKIYTANTTASCFAVGEHLLLEYPSSDSMKP
eukprot:m51a1_g323 hypothetical protein (218) ;mRNA; r:445557-446412